MKYIYIIIFLVLISGCKYELENFWGMKYRDLKTKDFRELKVNLKDLKTIDVPVGGGQKVKISKLIDTCFTVILETTKRSLIGRIDEIKIYNDEIFILDIEKAKAVFVFNFKGKFLRRIGDKGRGPGEYTRPDGFEIDKKNKELLISCAAMRKILRYDFKGIFLGDINPKIGSLDFKVLDSGNIVLLGGDQKNKHLGELKNKIVYIIDNKEKIVSYGPNSCTDFHDIRYSPANNLMVKNNVISYSYKFSDTIYSINDTEISALYKIDFGKYGIDRSKIKNTDDFFRERNRGDGIAYFLGSHLQTKDYLYFRYDYNGKDIGCFYNKNQSKLITGVDDDVDSDFIFVSPLTSSYKDYFISEYPSYSVVEVEGILRKHDEQRHARFMRLLKINGEFKLKEEDNPVLFFYKFKKYYDED